jgi:hypothetical protein
MTIVIFYVKKVIFINIYLRYLKELIQNFFKNEN